MPNILILPTIDVFDNISGYRRYKIMPFDSPQQGEVIAGQTARCLLRRLDCLKRSGTENIKFHTL